ncbi:Major cell-surface adhesin PAc precursor [Streptomyces sp. ADI95-17]|nr:Major cell-surface adhesin PAc precursor [Streptomyces sp. ADI95-17]
MIAAIKPAGANTRGLLAYLYGPGRHDEHLDPHIVAGFAMLGMPDPGRNPDATLTQLAHHLDEPVHLRNSEFGKKITDHVWHCPVRAAPEDRHLSDAEWADIAQRIVEAADIAPPGDDLGCRWIAVRHADDHIHILATTVREDGRRPKLHGSGIRVGDACRQIETDYGLRQLKKGDRTAGKRPTQAEMHKAERLGWDQTSRDWLQDRIRAAIPHAGNTEELLAYLEADGIAIKPRRGPSGDLLGYAVGRPGDLNKDGEQIFHPGGKIAPDLTLPKLKARLETTAPEEHPTARRQRPTTPWHQATDALDTLHQGMTDATHAQAHITARGELIEATAQKAPAPSEPNYEPLKGHSPAPSAPRSEPRTRPPTPCAARPATSPAPPPPLTAAPSPPYSPPSSGPRSSPPAGTRQGTTPTKPKPPAKPCTTSRQPPTTPSSRSSTASPLVSRATWPAEPWPMTSGPPSPTTPTTSSPTPPGRPSPPSSPMPKQTVTSHTSSSRKPLLVANSAPHTARPVS